jgi:eukaryotic-like serine/threonine-protein kinase
VTRIGDYELEHALSPTLFVARRDEIRVLLRIAVAPVGSDATRRMRIDEAGVAKWYAHPHLGRVIDIGFDGDHTWFAYEHIEGARLVTLDVPRDVAVSIGVQLCSALDYIHRMRTPSGDDFGGVHGSVPLRSIVVDTNGDARLLEFGGIARVLALDAGPQRELFSYLSPEAADGLPTDWRSDQYALASVLWDLTVGEPRMKDVETDYRIIEALRAPHAEPPSSRCPDYPRGLEHVIVRALSRDPAARFPSMAAFADALTGCTN